MKIVFYILGIVAAAVIWNTTTAFQTAQRNATLAQGPQPRPIAGVGAMGSFSVGVPAAGFDAITEAAYHQQSSEYMPPLDNEHSGGEEIFLV